MILFISAITNFIGRNVFGDSTAPVRSTAPTSATSRTRPLQVDQYTSNTPSTSSRPQQVQEQPKKSFWGRVWGAVRGVAVTLTATIVTGALIVSGVGIVGIAVAIGAGILAGTVVGVTTNAMTAIANGGTKKAWGEAFQQTVQDFKSSCIGAASAACGFGVARLVTGTGQAAATASLGTRLFASSAAGGAGATVSTVAGTVDQSIQLGQQFEKEHGPINSPEKERQYQEFLKQNNATWRQTIKNSMINVFTGFISGGLGARFQIARATNQSAISQGLNISRSQVFRSSIAAEASVLTGTGFVSSYATHGHLSLEDTISHIGGSYAGGYLGNISSRYVESRAHARAQQTPPVPSRNGQQQKQPLGRGLQDSKIPTSLRNSLNYARRHGNIRIELIENPPPGFNPHADVIQTTNPTTGQTQRQTTIRISDLSQLPHELRHTNRNRLVTPPQRDPQTGRLNKNDVRRYLAERALEEFQVRAARDLEARPNSTSVENVTQMQDMISRGNYREVVRYASRNGVGRDYRRDYITDAKETLASNGGRIVQRGNLLNSVKIESRNIPIEDRGISPQNVQQLLNAIKIIEESKWLVGNPDSLANIKLIVVEPYTNNGSGRSGKLWEPVLCIENTNSPEFIAITLVHEDQHHITKTQPRWKSIEDFEIKGKVPWVEHNWLEYKKRDGSTSQVKPPLSLLGELQSYHSGAKFILQLFKTSKVNPANRTSLFRKFVKDQQSAKEAIELLKSDPRYLNDEGRQWLHDLELQWKNLIPDMGINIPTLLGSSKFAVRDDGYSLLVGLYGLLDKGEGRSYLTLFNRYISTETSSYIVSKTARNMNIPLELRQSAIARFNSSEIQQDFIRSIEFSLSQSKNRMYGYEKISTGYELTTDGQRNKYTNLFQTSIMQETNIEFLRSLLTSPYISSDLKSHASNRIAQLQSCSFV